MPFYARLAPPLRRHHLDLGFIHVPSDSTFYIIILTVVVIWEFLIRKWFVKLTFWQVWSECTAKPLSIVCWYSRSADYVTQMTYYPEQGNKQRQEENVVQRHDACKTYKTNLTSKNNWWLSSMTKYRNTLQISI